MSFSHLFSVVDGSTDGDGFTSGSADSTGAKVIAVAVATFGGSIDSMTDSKGNTYTAGTALDSGSGARFQWWYCLNPTVGAGHTFTPVATGKYPAIVVRGFSANSPSFDQESAGGTDPGSATTKQPGSVTPAAAENVVLVGAEYGQPTPPTIDGGFTTTGTGNVATQHMGCSGAYLVQSSATAQNPTWTWGSGTDVATRSLVFTDTGGGGGEPQYRAGNVMVMSRRYRHRVGRGR